MLTTIKIEAPYLILIGDAEDVAFAKTGLGIVHWRRELVAGQLRFPGCPLDLGVPDLTVQEAVASGARSLIIGVAPVGGKIPDSWWTVIEEAAASGLDIVSGLHFKLADFPAIAAAANASGAKLIDVRTPPETLPIGTGRKRSGKRLLTVGTDCAVGKKYSALSIDLAMKKAGFQSSFRATGQTGIMIAGSGIPIDCVIGDFISGAAEVISPDNEEDHWDVIEGQGSLFHPSYAGVSLGLLHGAQPDAIVVCHDPQRKEMLASPGFAVPTVSQCIERNLLEARLTNPKVQCVGVCVNTSAMQSGERSSYLEALSQETRLPCVDPVAGSCEAIITFIEETVATNKVNQNGFVKASQ